MQVIAIRFSKERKETKITIIGTGYVGLVTGTCLASTGNEVTCVDIDKDKVASMKSGKIPIYEPGLEDIFNRVLSKNKLHITTELAHAIKGSPVIFLALPTPPGADGAADLSAVLYVAKQLGPLLENYTVIVNKSTVPVGTGERVAELIKTNATVSFEVVSNPEFLREGFAVDDFLHPDRIVIGTDSKKARRIMTRIYKSFITEQDQLVFMDIRSAELTKYAANAFLAMKVSFMNEIANLCEHVGANVDNIRLGIGPDRRIGKRHLRAGIGYGGSCWPKDVQALLNTARSNDYVFRLLESIVDVNIRQKLRLVHKLKAYYGGGLKGKHFAIWGLSFKPDTDDIRESPALYIIDKLLELGAHVTVYDPQAMPNAKKYYGERNTIVYSPNAHYATKDADALLIVTDWDEFRYPDFKKLKSNLKAPVILDGRNLFHPEFIIDQGFHYESIGRPNLLSANSQ